MLGGPLHPLNRAPPSASSLSFASASISSEGISWEGNFTAPAPAPTTSVFTAPTYSRKRNLYASPTMSPTMGSSYSVSSLDSQADHQSQHTSASSFDIQLSSSKASMKDSGSFEMNQNKAPQGEFSFHSQAPISDRQFDDLRPVGTSSKAFAELAQAHRVQQEVQKQIASGARMEEHEEGPMMKKRRGVTGVLVDTAVSAAIYSGAVAFTAYSLWSNWGSRGRKQSNSSEEVFTTWEKMPADKKSTEEPPPPPYIDRRNSKKCGNSSKVPMSPPRSGHVFVSSRRRRPAFQSHKSARTGTPKSVASKASQAARVIASEPTSPFNYDLTSPTNYDEDEDMDSDDTFARMQAKLETLIDEGNQALQSRVNLEEIEQANAPKSSSSAVDLKRSNRDSAGIYNRFESSCSASSSPTPTTQANISNLPVSPQRTRPGRSSQAWSNSRIPRLGALATPPANNIRY